MTSRLRPAGSLPVPQSVFSRAVTFLGLTSKRGELQDVGEDLPHALVLDVEVGPEPEEVGLHEQGGDWLVRSSQPQDYGHLLGHFMALLPREVAPPPRPGP